MTTRIELDGGALALVESSHAVPIVTIIVAFRSGAAHDPVGREGIARFTARMLRRGAGGMTARAIEDALDRLGGEMSVDATASTLLVHTQVIGRNVDAFVDLLAKLLAEPDFPEDELARLRRESLAELVEIRDNDRAVAQIAFRCGLFAGHPYGRPTSGTEASLSAIGESDARDFYRTHLTRANLVVGFAGDVTAARAAELGARLAGALPAGARPADHVGPPTAKPGQRLLFVDKPERTQTQIVVGSLGTWPHDDDHMAITVANGVLGGTFTSRLMREVRSKRGWSYGASSRLTIDRQRHSFQMWTFPAAADAAACLELELGLLNDFVNDGIQADELAFIQSYLSRSYAFEIDTAAKRMHQAADVELLGLPPRYYDDHVATVRAVTLAEANASIARRIDPRSLLIVVLGTARDILEPIKERIPSLDAVEVVPFDADFG